MSNPRSGSKYSQHHEMPISGLASLAWHILAAVLIVALAFVISRRDDADMPIESVTVGGGGGSPQGVGPGRGDAGLVEAAAPRDLPADAVLPKEALADITDLKISAGGLAQGHESRQGRRARDRQDRRTRHASAQASSPNSTRKPATGCSAKARAGPAPAADRAPARAPGRRRRRARPRATSARPASCVGRSCSTPCPATTTCGNSIHSAQSWPSRAPTAN